MSGFEIVSIIAISVLSFLLFLALFEPSLRYRVSEPPEAPLDSEHYRRLLATLGDSALYGNTTVDVLANGEVFYDAVLDAIRGAKRSINIEAYIFVRGRVTEAFIDALTERARAGVRVNMVIDAIGSFLTTRSYLRDLINSGANIYYYHGFVWHQLPRLNSRTHREIVVVDCKVAFIGGPGFADHWRYGKKGKPRWRDTMFRLEGDAVAAVQSTFVENFLEASGELLTGSEYFCFDKKPSRSTVLVVDSSVSSGQSTRARMLYQTLFSTAKEYVDIATPYFLPDRGLRKELIRAVVQRNVRVRVMCPGQHNDHLLTRHTSRRLYGELLRAGVQIYEYEAAMLHVKSLIVDGKWAVFGSTNMDHRSFSINDELNIATDSSDVVVRLREDFARDLQECSQVTYAQWRRRSLFERGYEGLGRLLERQQ